MPEMASGWMGVFAWFVGGSEYPARAAFMAINLMKFACGKALHHRDFNPQKAVVRLKGLEPSLLSEPEPKSGASTNFATAAQPLLARALAEGMRRVNL
jgi:hypothetical protein